MNVSALAKQLRSELGNEAVLRRPEDLMLYEYDAGLAKGTPDIVVLPQTTEQVSTIVRLAAQAGVAIVARGAGTGLSGGSVPRQGGIVVVFSRMRKILEINVDNRRAVVQPGVVNLELSQAVAKHGLYFAPDPSSQRASTIGGNVAENSGGPHTLAYGVTVNHVTGLEVVLADGRVAHFGGKAIGHAGYDLTGFFVGTEGTVGIVTAITVKLSRLPERIATLLAIFQIADDAANTVTALTAAGITPSALEMLDGWTLRAVEAATHAGYPLDCGAVLLIEVEGLHEEVEEQSEAIARVCQANRAREVRRAKDERERQLLWIGRKNAFAAIGRLAPSYYTQDGVVPRTKIAEVLHFIEGIADKYQMKICNIFHAGDGNLHPAILFDLRDPRQVEQVHAAGREILTRCVELGGTLTGEHGIGMEKNELMPVLFNDDDLEVMARLRNAFNPQGLFNPQKIFPAPRGCREGVMSQHPVEVAR